MALRLFNTLTREKEEFEPLEEGKVRFYSCGQTIYDDLHVGNARAYVVWDTLRRYLEYENNETETPQYTVRHVQNITDVGHLTDDADQGEDKVEQRAEELGVEPMELVEEQLARYFRDTAELNIGRTFRHTHQGRDHPEVVRDDVGLVGADVLAEHTGRQDIMPRATGHVNEMIRYVQRILDNGYAYERNGNIYFDVDSFIEDHPYAEMANKDIEQLKEEARSRVEPDERKKNQYDFALWLNAEGTGHAMRWDAVFNVNGERIAVEGYPGWHLECSVMSQKYLGETFDIHAGGKDHIFPHHPNERAQSMAATGSGQAAYWLHNEFIQVEGEKMSKSEGNFYTVRELLRDGYSGDAIRLYLLSSHYRSETDFSIDGLEKAEKELSRVRKAVKRLSSSGRDEGTSIEEFDVQEKFEEAMDDDLNTAKAKQALMAFTRTVNERLDDGETFHHDVRRRLIELFGVLGIDVRRPQTDSEQELIDILLETREELREEGLYDMADTIRDDLETAGLVVEDTEDGQFWWKK